MATMNVVLTMNRRWWTMPCVRLAQGVLWAIAPFISEDRARAVVGSVSGFIVEHGIVIGLPSKASSDIDERTRQYFERAPIGHHVCPQDVIGDEE